MGTTGYGSWNNYNGSELLPTDGINSLTSGADSEWLDLFQESGAAEEVEREYRRQINAALPPGVSLCGSEFYGPAYVEPGEWDEYPHDEFGRLHMKEIIQSVSLAEILEEVIEEREL